MEVGLSPPPFFGTFLKNFGITDWNIFLRKTPCLHQLPAVIVSQPSIFHPYPKVKAYKPNNILGNFKLDIQKNHCQLQVSLADTLHSCRTFDLSFTGMMCIQQSWNLDNV